MAKRNRVYKSRKNDSLMEAFRQLRTNIEFSSLDTGIKVINVVSTNPNEGKSTVASNLAKIYGDKYKRVLIIDCDLRNPSIHKMYHVSNMNGLSDLLSHYNKSSLIADYPEIQHYHFDDINRDIDVLTAGSKVINSSELLSTHRFHDLIKQARNEYDIVVIDCPPCVAVSDAIPVCNVSDGTLYVVSEAETDKFAARMTMNDLSRNGANIIGIALTKVEDYGNKHGYYYGSDD